MSSGQLRLEEVFVTEGVPEFTFVKPPNFNEILLDIRRPGKPVIVEGQSGTGKTTCVRRAIADLKDKDETKYLSARDATHVSTIEAISRKEISGRFVIDDFHRLAQPLQARLADIAKFAAEQGTATELPKLIIIGINQIGSELIQLVPDIAKRTGIHRIKQGSKEDIARLIEAGCSKLNIRIDRIDGIYSETQGDYWLTQQICQSICSAADVMETQEKPHTIQYDLANIRNRVVEKLHSAFYPAVKDFCRGRRFRPSNDPYYKLLRAVGQQDSSVVDINGLANANEDVRGSINNIKEHRLAVLLESKPAVAKHFYYNEETKNFAIEDPALFYFVKHLDWQKLRQDCGFKDDPAGREFQYEIAISFAGENRALGRFIAKSLEDLDVSVFFDEMFETNFLGKTWTKQFSVVFGQQSRLVVCLLDKFHLEKIWPTFEREHFMPRVADESVIPIFLDDTKFVGIPQDLVGIKFSYDPNDPNWESKATEEIVFKLIDKIG